MHRHGFVPSALEHSPRPTEHEIFVSSPGFSHEERTRQQPQGGMQRG